MYCAQCVDIAPPPSQAWSRRLPWRQSWATWWNGWERSCHPTLWTSWLMNWGVLTMWLRYQCWMFGGGEGGHGGGGGSEMFRFSWLVYKMHKGLGGWGRGIGYGWGYDWWKCKCVQLTGSLSMANIWINQTWGQWWEGKKLFIQMHAFSMMNLLEPLLWSDFTVIMNDRPEKRCAARELLCSCWISLG